MIHRIKKSVPGGMLFRAATGDWTFRLDGEVLWRQVALDSEDAALAALGEAITQKKKKEAEA